MTDMSTPAVLARHVEVNGRCHWCGGQQWPCDFFSAWDLAEQATALRDELLTQHQVLTDELEAARDPERLADALDHHWLAQGIATGTAYCTCGGWEFDAKSGQRPLPVMGEVFRPFSEHVATALLDTKGARP